MVMFGLGGVAVEVERVRRPWIRPEVGRSTVRRRGVVLGTGMSRVMRGVSNWRAMI
jgi:hypothetical protein